MLCGFTHYYTISAHIDVVLFQRPGRRACDVLSVQIVMTVMAGAPDMIEVGPVLNDASQMSANRAETTDLSFWSSDQYSGLAAKAKDLPGIRFYLFRLDRKSNVP